MIRIVKRQILLRSINDKKLWNAMIVQVMEWKMEEEEYFSRGDVGSLRKMESVKRVQTTTVCTNALGKNKN